MNITINRRQFLSCLIAAGVAPGILAKSPSHREYWISAQGKNSDTYSMTSFNEMKKTTQSVISGFRGHGMAQNPAQPESVVMFARRPGKYGIDVNIVTGEINHKFEIAKNRSLLGHGCFSKDGKLLYTAEADSVTGDGKIVVRESHNYQQLTEMDSYGIGPHEIKLMPDAKTLVVANGGILTRAETGRKQLNLDSMKSCLTYIDVASGKKLDEFCVDESKASIRHLDVADDGSVAFAMQLQRKAMNHDQLVPLAGIHKPGQAIQLLNKPAAIIQAMNDYMGSVAINQQTRIAGFTSPKGNLVAFWNIDNGEFAGYHQLNDVCGLTVSSDQSHFIISNSFGELRQLDAFTLKENKPFRQRLANSYWDNHMITVSL